MICHVVSYEALVKKKKHPKTQELQSAANGIGLGALP